MATGLIATWALGTQPLWPDPLVDIGDIFDRPPWERPTEDNGGITLPDVDEVFTGDPGFGNGPGFDDGGSGVGVLDDDGPGWQGGDGPGGIQWTPGDGSAGDGGTVTVVTGTGVVSIHIQAHRIRFYTIEVHDENNDLLTHVPGWTRGKLKLQVDKASELEFTIPYDAEGAADLVRPNTVWLRDRWGFVVDTFQIQKRRPRGTGDGSYYDIVCQGVISQLAEEVVVEYSEDSITATVLDHVTALMAQQQKGNPLEIGTISPSIAETELPFYVFDTTIHEALLRLQLLLPADARGRIYVDPQRRLQWRDEIGDTTEQIITRASNVWAIEAETDYTRMINRVYMYGEGQDPNYRLTLIDAGEAEEYLEDTDSQITYGLRPFQKQDRRIKKPETLLIFAERILSEFSTPPVTVSVELLDIAKAENAPAGWQDIYIGGQYRVQDTDLGIDYSIEIVGIEVDLAHPVPLRVDLTNQTRDLGDLFSVLIEQLQQPLDVDGERYPTMGRNYSATDPRIARAGDVRWSVADDRGEMHDGANWRDLGGDGDAAAIWYLATTKAGLPNTDIAETALGRVTAGAQKGMVCVRNPDNDGWDAINFFET